MLKRTYICLVIIVLAIFPSFGEDSSTYSSMINRLERLKDYNRDEPEKAIEIFKSAMKEADSSSDTRIKARVLIAFADYLLRHDYASIADVPLLTARKLAPATDTLLQADIIECLAFQKSVMEEDSLAASYYSRAEKMFRSLGENEKATLATLNMGVAAHKLKHTSEALRYYNTALIDLRRRNDFGRQSSVVAYVAQLTESPQKKDSLLASALEMAIKSDNSTALFQIYLYQARNGFDRGNYALAAALADKALLYQQAIPSDNPLRTSPLLLIAKVYAAKNEYSAAYEALQRYAEENQEILKLRAALAPKLTEAARMLSSEPPGDARSKSYTVISVIALVIALIIIAALAMQMMRRKKQIRSLREKVNELDDSLQTTLTERNETARKLLRHTMGYLNYCAYLGRLSDSLKEACKGDKAKMTAAVKTEITVMTQFLSSEHKLLLSDDMAAAIETLKQTMAADFPDFTPETLDMALWLRLGFTTKDICKASGKKTETVQMTRYRLRKMLNIASNVSLEEYIRLRWPELPPPLGYTRE